MHILGCVYVFANSTAGFHIAWIILKYDTYNKLFEIRHENVLLNMDTKRTQGIKLSAFTHGCAIILTICDNLIRSHDTIKVGFRVLVKLLSTISSDNPLQIN